MAWYFVKHGDNFIYGTILTNDVAVPTVIHLTGRDISMKQCPKSWVMYVSLLSQQWRINMFHRSGSSLQKYINTIQVTRKQFIIIRIMD